MAGMPDAVLDLITADETAYARAHAALTPAELATFEGFRFPKRRQDWLLGRLAAKEAIRRAAGADWALSAIAVAPLPNGCPTFVAPEGALSGWHLSISHGHGRAAAAVAPVPVGVDYEALREVPPNGWRFFLTAAERDWLAAEPLGPRGEIVVWALKEAGYKAIQGAVSGVLKLQVEAAAEGRATLVHPAGRLAARYARSGDAVLAVAVPEGDRAVLDAFPLHAPA